MPAFGTISTGLVLALVAGFGAGCLGEPQASAQENDHRVMGAFTEAASQADLHALDAHIRALGGTMLVMESFPMQYSVTVPSAADCERARGILEASEAVASVGVCRAVEPPSDPEEVATSR